MAGPVAAQEAEPKATAPADAAPAQAAPADEPTTLPPVVVETKQGQPKVQAKKKGTAPTVTGAPQPASSTQASTASGKSDATSYGPVDGYAADNTATGIKTNTPLKEIPQSISVVGKEQIRDQGAQSLQDTLRYTAGVIADGYGLDSRTDTSFVRATEAAEYLDGLRRTFNYYVYSYRIDPYFMERIEVLRGPPSVLYGQAPVGGIINSVSKRPQSEQANEITIEYGTFDFKQVKFDMTGPMTADGKWSYRLTGLARDAETQVDYVDDDRMAIQPEITYRPVAGTSITLIGHFQKDHTGSTQQFLPHVGTIFPSASGFIARERFMGDPDDKYDTEVASGTLLVEHKIDQTFKLQHSMRYADIHNEYNSSYPGFFAGDLFGNPNFPYLDPDQRTIDRIKSISIADTQIFNSDTNLEAKFATGVLRHKLLGGVDYADFRAQSSYGDALNLTPFDLYDPQYGLPGNLLGFTCDGVGPAPLASVDVCDSPDQHVTQTGLYIQDQLRLGNWIAVVGARHDWLANGSEGSETQKDQASTYRAGLMYEFASGFTPYVSYAQSFVPVIARTFDNSPMDPQQGEMYEAGFKYQPAGANFTINSAVYDITENNRLSSDPAHPNFSVQGGAVSIRGFEIEAIGQVASNLKMIASYSYTDAQYTGGDQVGFNVESVPNHLASLWSIYSFDEGVLSGWSAGAGVRYIGASWDGYDQFQTPAVTLFDGMIAYETREWRWSLNGYNLEDKDYLTTCLARGDCFRGTARTITTGLTYKF